VIAPSFVALPSYAPKVYWVSQYFHRYWIHLKYREILGGFFELAEESLFTAVWTLIASIIVLSLLK
jgi:hypothetical protein